MRIARRWVFSGFNSPLLWAGDLTEGALIGVSIFSSDSHDNDLLWAEARPALRLSGSGSPYTVVAAFPYCLWAESHPLSNRTGQRCAFTCECYDVNPVGARIIVGRKIKPKPRCFHQPIHSLVRSKKRLRPPVVNSIQPLWCHQDKTTRACNERNATHPIFRHGSKRDHRHPTFP